MSNYFKTIISASSKIIHAIFISTLIIIGGGFIGFLIYLYFDKFGIPGSLIALIICAIATFLEKACGEERRE